MQYDEEELIETFGVVNFMLCELRDYKIYPTNLTLQKLLFFAYGIHLSLFDEKLFPSEIQAWKLGPVVPVVYQEFKAHKSFLIERMATITTPEGEIDILPLQKEQNANKVRSIETACLVYGRKSARELVDDTHKEGYAWYKAYKKNEHNIVISDDDIRNEFDERLLTEIGKQVFDF